MNQLSNTTFPATGPWARVRTLADIRIMLMLALGFSSGLPILLAFNTLSIWLREAGVSLGAIGLFSYLLLAYAFKFVWAPFIDAFDVPVLSRLLGRRRGWMLLAQSIITLGLLGIALSNPATNVAVTAVFAFIVALASATQDVVIDGWRIEAAPTSKQGTLAASYQLGYRLALICAGAGALYLAEFSSWLTAYAAMASLMSIGIAATLLAPAVGRDREPAVEPSVRSGRTGAAAAFTEPLADLFRRKGPMLALILILVALYRLPDFVAGVMAGPLYVDLGFSKAEIASVSKLYGVWIGIIGAFAGGFAIARFGLFPSLIFGAATAAASNLMFSWLALQGAKLELLIFAISVDNFSGSFAGTALIAYMSGLTGAGFAATQYALLSSLYALPGKVVGGLSGYMVQAFGYPTFFALTAAIGIPVVLLCLVLARIAPETDRDIKPETVPAPEAKPA